MSNFEMSLSEATLLLFTVFNGARILAYIPQIRAAARDRTGSRAVSRTTWSLFFVANLSGVGYALVNVDDLRLALIFAGNAVCCLAIVLATMFARRRHQKSYGAPLDEGRAVYG